LERFRAGEVAVGDALRLAGGSHPPPKDVLLKLRRTVGMVFQSFNLFPHMTALGNVMCGPVHALGKSRAEAEAIARPLLERVGLAAKADAMPAQLSGGQQQRVAIARALAVNPAAILFDEPTSALDPKMAAEVRAVMARLAADGQTMIVVTHDTEFVRHADVVHRLEAGRVVQTGPPGDVLE
jgi:ABC-type polar amino acid transport system ATPase subunit